MSANTELLQKQNKNRLEQIFYEGCKSKLTLHLGVELEHFIVKKKTQEAIPYQGEHGISYILGKLLESYPDARGVYERGMDHTGKSISLLFGIATKEFSLSLEPAAQLEISISPRESIADIEKTYKGFREHLDFILNECDAECVTAGYHPHNKAEDLALIQKERYQVMDAYFSKLGTGGREMMRATASTQVSIDYTSCSDFRKKFQAAYVLTPVFKYFTDSTPVYEGKRDEMWLRRTQIWERVDKERTGIVPGSLSGDFSFRDYADYLWNMPLVYCPREFLPLSFIGEQKFSKAPQRTISAVGSLTPAQIWKQDEMTQDAAWHIMSMAFPDVRLKNYIEIRGMDSMPIEKALGYIALVKGLLYHPLVIDRIDQEIQLQNIMECHIKQAEESIMQEGKQAVVYQQNIDALSNKLLQVAHAFLPKEEQRYLDIWKKK